MTTVSFQKKRKFTGRIKSLRHPPRGGCSMSPFLSQVPIGWMSDESTSRQKSLVLSLPSKRSRRRVPIMPITVAMHTELELRGSLASSFIPALKSLEGGTLAWRTSRRHKFTVTVELCLCLIILIIIIKPNHDMQMSVPQTDVSPTDLRHRTTTVRFKCMFMINYLLKTSRRSCDRRRLPQIVLPAERF